MAKQTPADLQSYAAKYIIGKPHVDRRAAVAGDATGAQAHAVDAHSTRGFVHDRGAMIRAIRSVLVAARRDAARWPRAEPTRRRRASTSTASRSFCGATRRTTSSRRTCICSAERSSSLRRRRASKSLLLDASERGTKRFPRETRAPSAPRDSAARSSSQPSRRLDDVRIHDASSDVRLDVGGLRRSTDGADAGFGRGGARASANDRADSSTPRTVPIRW